MIPEFVSPRYQGNALCNLMPSILDRLDGAPDPVIALPNAQKYVVVMVDGLGRDILHRWGDHAERLLDMEETELTCSVPSTTACSLTSLGTGRPPGRHGVVGYTFRDPEVQAVVNALTWEHGQPDLDVFRQEPTRFQQLAAAGHHAGAVTLGRFDGSALTRLAFDGTVLYARPADESDVDGTVALVETALAHHDVVYCYQRLLDHAGHSYGTGSWQWLQELETVDDLAAGIAALSGDDICVVITGDHGMINVPQEHRIIAEDEPCLAGFHAIAGEGRYRQLYTEFPEPLAKAWQQYLGERAQVLLREEAIDAGWYGPEVTQTTSGRIGDVLVAMRSDWAVMSRTFPDEFSLVGMHGSLTHSEMVVPLCMRGGQR